MSAGKGDRNRTADLNAYRSSPLWDNLSKQHNSLSEFTNDVNIFVEKQIPVKALFIDDIREPRDAYVNNDRLTTISGIPEHSWDIVRSYDEFVNYITQSDKELVISFDFDLDMDEDNVSTNWRDSKIKTGAHCAEWLITRCMLDEANLLKYYIHSTNPTGRAIIENILREIVKN